MFTKQPSDFLLQWNEIDFEILKDKRHMGLVDLYQNGDEEAKVEGAKTNTSPKINTYKRLPITNTLLLWTIFHERSARAHKVTGLGIISGTIAHQPPLHIG